MQSAGRHLAPERIILKKDMRNRIEKAVKVLREGGLVVIPTETVYGICADPFNREAVDRIYKLKERDERKPLQLLIHDKGTAAKLATGLNRNTNKFLDENWPGPLTVILKKKRTVPNYITGGLKSVGLRVPDHPVALEIIRRFGPVAATSANISGKDPAITVAQAKKNLPKGIDLFIDGGKCKIGISSKVIRIKNGKIDVIRK